MNARLLALLFVAASTSAITQAPSPRANLQQSLSFEDQTGPSLTGWFTNPPGAVFVDNRVTHSGHSSVRFQPDAQSANAFSVISRSLPHDFQGSTIELRGYMRLQDVSGYASLWLREDADGASVAFKNMEMEHVNGTRDWMEYRVALPVSPQAQSLVFGALLSGTGTLWADDLELLVDGKPIAQAISAPIPQGLPADHEFVGGSRISLTSLTPTQISNLATLAQVWGFLKYHHPAVTAGQFHWDYELFRILPTILAATDRSQANESLVAWIKKLGPIPTCSPCASAPSGELDLKPDLAWIHDSATLSQPLSQLLQSIYANRTGKQFFVAITPGTGNPSFDHEPLYAQIKFPDSGYQLLALFRWWNIMQYWAPYRNAADQDWPKVLDDFIPRIALAKDKNAYQLALFELIAKANDTHANLWNALDVRPPVGACALPLTLRFLNNQAIVYRTNSTTGEFQPGDILNSLDGTPISTLTQQWSPYYADSNTAARQRDLATYLTRGACGPVSLDITRNGHAQHISATRIQLQTDYSTHDLPGDTFRLLSPQVAYLKLSSIKAANLPAYFEKAKDTKGLILDIRNYPEWVLFPLGAYLAAKPTAFANMTRADLANPGAFLFTPSDILQPGPSHYAGKIVILVDETSQSRAEYTAMAFRAIPNSVVIGSTTAGADGDTSDILLPGGQYTMISGLGVFYPDHRPTQRIGIVPDVTVIPTIAAIAAGRDELIEAATRIITERK